MFLICPKWKEGPCVGGSSLSHLSWCLVIDFGHEVHLASLMENHVWCLTASLTKDPEVCLVDALSIKDLHVTRGDAVDGEGEKLISVVHFVLEWHSSSRGRRGMKVAPLQMANLFGLLHHATIDHTDHWSLFSCLCVCPCVSWLQWKCHFACVCVCIYLSVWYFLRVTREEEEEGEEERKRASIHWRLLASASRHQASCWIVCGACVCISVSPPPLTARLNSLKDFTAGLSGTCNSLPACVSLCQQCAIFNIQQERRRVNSVHHLLSLDPIYVWERERISLAFIISQCVHTLHKQFIRLNIYFKSRELLLLPLSLLLLPI